MPRLFLIDDLFVWLPLNGIILIAEHIHERLGGDDQTRAARLRKQLLEVRLRYEMDEIDEDEYERAIAEVLQQLRAVNVQPDEGAEPIDGDEN